MRKEDQFKYKKNKKKTSKTLLKYDRRNQMGKKFDWLKKNFSKKAIETMRMN